MDPSVIGQMAAVLWPHTGEGAVNKAISLYRLAEAACKEAKGGAASIAETVGPQSPRVVIDPAPPKPAPSTTPGLREAVGKLLSCVNDGGVVIASPYIVRDAKREVEAALASPPAASPEAEALAGAVDGYLDYPRVATIEELSDALAAYRARFPKKGERDAVSQGR